MSDDKNKVTDKASEIARNIWLAGVGAYGRAVDEAQSSLKKAAPQPPKLFRDLVKAGAALEEEASGARTSHRSSVEERIAQVRENFHKQRPARIEDVENLRQKIDRLSRKVDALTRLIKEQEERQEKGRKKPAGQKRAATRKASSGESTGKAGEKSANQAKARG